MLEKYLLKQKVDLEEEFDFDNQGGRRGYPGMQRQDLNHKLFFPLGKEIEKIDHCEVSVE